MKVFFSLPKSEDEQRFYSRYAPLVPTAKKTGYLAQVVSAGTEFGVIYSIAFSNLVPLFPERAAAAALVLAVVGVAFIEIGLRKFLPYGARAVIHRRWQGLDGWISGFVLVACLILLGTSGALSFTGSRSLVAAVAPPPEITTTQATDSTTTARKESTAANYSEMIGAVEQSAAADLLELDAALLRYVEREDRTGRRYTTKKNQIREQIEGVKAERARRVAKLRTERAQALARIDEHHAVALEELEKENDTAQATAAALVDDYGNGLAYFTLFGLLVLVLSVIIVELHHAGSGMSENVEPGAYDFEAGPLVALVSAVGGWIDRKVYGLIHQIERGTTDAPEPVAAPTVWKREREGIPHAVTRRGAVRKAGKIAPTPAPSRREIGWKAPTQAPAASNASTQCVDDAKTVITSEAKTGTCEHCGSTYTKRTTWQKFCREECRKDHHAEKHGKPYTPKPWQ
jgi:hypothetical protein